MTAPAPRNRYLADSVSTASPGRLLVMLYDRLVVDLGQAEDALLMGDRDTGRTRLMHAQDIVTELRASLDVEAWDGGPGLAALYAFMLTEMVGANVTNDAARVASCRRLVEPLRDAWREAVMSRTAETANAGRG